MRLINGKQRDRQTFEHIQGAWLIQSLRRQV